MESTCNYVIWLNRDEFNQCQEKNFNHIMQNGTAEAGWSESGLGPAFYNTGCQKQPVVWTLLWTCEVLMKITDQRLEVG